MAQTFKELTGGTELFHEVLRDGEHEVDVIIKADREIHLHQSTETKPNLRDTVRLPLGLFRKLIEYGPRVIQEAEGIKTNG